MLVFERNPEGAGRKGGIAHFGFRLLDAGEIDAAIEAVEKAGGKIIDKGEFVPGETLCLFTDLNGYEVEVWYELPTPVDPCGPASSPACGGG